MAGYFLAAPARQAEKADLIVSLGGEWGRRVQKAAELYRQGFSSRILLTGYEGGPIGPKMHFLNWRPQFLEDHGVPKSALLFDSASRNTWDEAVNTLRLMQQNGWKKALVVSDPPHMRRLSWVWTRVFAGSGKEFRLVANSMDGWEPGRWWKDDTAAHFVMTEYIKIFYYFVTY